MYFGSVKFFKNMILVFVLLAISVSAGFAIHYHHQWKTATGQISADRALVGETVYASVDSDPVIYQELYPDFYAPQSYCATERKAGLVYLTFDGAPSVNTPQILRVLKEQDIKATFFISGTAAPDAEAQLKSIVAAGHTVGMSSWSDDYQSLYGSVESYLADMYEIFTYIKETTGVTPTVFRFQGGSINSYNAGIYQELVAEMIRRGFVPYDWNISVTDDGSSASAESLADKVDEQITSMDRAVILLRDNASTNAAIQALPMIITRLQQRGFLFAALQPSTLPVLFAYPK